MNEIRELLNKSSLDFKTNENLPFSLIYPFYSKVREKELSHSEVLRCLLDPEENHEHKSEFLKIFFEEIGLKEDFEKLTEVSVYTEFGSKVSKERNSRPIDIFISYKKDIQQYGIIIENKLNYAVNQSNQINDYFDGIVRENYICSKIVYMHINPSKTVELTDTRKDILALCYNFDITKLISSLEPLKKYSYIKEYQHLLLKISNSFMEMNNAIEIQNELSYEELSKLIKVSNLVNSDSWNEAKHNRILEKLELKEIKHSYQKQKKFSQFYFQDYKFWVELWYYPNSYKLWLCSYDEELEGVKCNKWGIEQGRYFFELEDNEFKYPNDEDRMIDEIRSILIKSRK